MTVVLFTVTFTLSNAAAVSAEKAVPQHSHQISASYKNIPEPTVSMFL
jgi:hypothetical protein